MISAEPALVKSDRAGSAPVLGALGFRDTPPAGYGAAMAATILDTRLAASGVLTVRGRSGDEKVV